jgi:hypothetical protein
MMQVLTHCWTKRLSCSFNAQLDLQCIQYNVTQCRSTTLLAQLLLASTRGLWAGVYMQQRWALRGMAA